MRRLIGAVLGVLLSGITQACSPSHPTAEAKPGGDPGPIKVALNSTNPIRADWRVGDPISYSGLTIFPVLSDATVSADGFITLDEGLKSGEVVVTEMSARESTPGRVIPGVSQTNVRSQARVNTRMQASTGAQVNQLALVNKSGKMLILIAGEILTGGKQDRICARDRIVPPTDSAIPLDVFCVEHGRWTGAGSFSANTHLAVDGANGAPKPSAGGGGGGGMANISVREKAEARKSQEEVWGKVADTVKVSEAPPASGTLNGAYQDEKVSKKIQDYENRLSTGLGGRNVIGIVVALGGRVVSADVFADSALFQQYRPKLLRSYALETMSQNGAAKNMVDSKDARSFLSAVDGQANFEGEERVYKLTEHQSASEASFELEATSERPSLLVHFNRVRKGL